MPRDHVLVVEDHQDTRELLHLVLTRAGFRVTGVGTLQEARDAVQSGHYDLYLMDSRFPDGSGFDFCRELRVDDQKTPAVFYSGLAHPDEQQQGLEAGADVYLTKPMESSHLIEALKTLLRKELKT